MAPISLVVFDLDGTLFDSHRLISHCIKLTFDALLPDQAPSEAEVHRLISSGAGLQETFKALFSESSISSSFKEDKWTATYCSLYAEYGTQRSLPVAVVSNKGVAAVSIALKNNNMGGSIHEALIVGGKTAGATRKPDPGSYLNVILPALKTVGYTKAIDVATVFVVGDTGADIRFAKNIGGAKSVWCRYGYGNRGACETLEPDFTVDSLQEIADMIKNSVLSGN
ncbi:hypothetical protein VTL71DRAFT_2154 [Oculimacula yallundae]|uniref:Phosphoglycolate phosphatase n=1 Tax=Oculimacula yallundae TaxID=86028 RepID=A0ABR4CAA1_9HELO